MRVGDPQEKVKEKCSMPLPKTSNIGKIYDELKGSKTKRSQKQMLAIALSQARKYGNKSLKK